MEHHGESLGQSVALLLAVLGRVASVVSAFSSMGSGLRAGSNRIVCTASLAQRSS